MYKTLGFKWLFEMFCPASAFVTADSDEARNPQRFIHVTVVANFKISARQLIFLTERQEKIARRKIKQ